MARLTQLGLIALAIILSACQEDIQSLEVQPDPSPQDPSYEELTLIDSDGNTGQYFLDSKPVRPENFEEAYVLGQTVVVTKGEQSDTGPSELEVHSFTDTEEYFNFSEENGGHARAYYAFDQDILEINSRFDVYDFFDKTGNLPDGYNDAIRDLRAAFLKSLYPKYQEDVQKLLGIVRLYRDCSPQGDPGGSFRPGSEFMPFMIFGFNNEVSMFGRFSIISLNMIYDRGFYQDRFMEVTGSSIFDGFNNVRFCPGERLFFINDRMSSGAFGGI